MKEKIKSMFEKCKCNICIKVICAAIIGIIVGAVIF
tara:strand:- start:214 stop:321 length:108 start_codon:yes stop_codon:yes gene_type:complete